MKRVLLLALVLTVAIAGCTESGVADDFPGIGTGDAEGTTTSPDETSSGTGSFELLVSDQPTAIDEFDSLEVTFSHARIFPKNKSGLDRGFERRDLSSPTVDLTQVQGTKAMPVLTTELSAGTYQKVELHVEDINAVSSGGEDVPDEDGNETPTEGEAAGGDANDDGDNTDDAEGGDADSGDSVDVRVPPGKLMITKPFNISASGETSFVFDIDIVKRGQAGGYNLLPNIGESGVANQDVQVDRVGPNNP